MGKLRSAQFASAADPQRCNHFAIDLVRAKAANQRALLMRNGSGPERDRVVADIAKQLKRNFSTSCADISSPSSATPYLGTKVRSPAAVVFQQAASEGTATP